MSDEELNAENEQDLWAAAAEDLVKQKEMLRDAAAEGEEEEIENEGETPDDEVAETDEAPPPAPAASHPVSGATSEEMGRILDIPMKVTVELGRSRMLINDLMQLGQGSVIELSKLVGDALDVKINDKLIGQGEVVVINEKFGVRITEIASAEDRIESMS